MNIKCPSCRRIYVTERNDPSTWGCPCNVVEASGQTFTVDPYAIRTQFAPATRPTSTLAARPTNTKD